MYETVIKSIMRSASDSIPADWSNAFRITHYYDLSGAEITLNPGKTYIGICPADLQIHGITVTSA